MTSRQVFDESDRYKVRQWKISDEIICPLLRQFLAWFTPDWDQKIAFLTYLKNKNVEISKLKKKLYPEQLIKLQEDNPDVTKWDTTLIHLVLRYCGGLADKDDIAWSSKSGKEPECLITSFKDIRNAIAHETIKLNQRDFFKKTEEIRTLLGKALSSVRKTGLHVSQIDIDTKVAYFNTKLNEIRDANITPRTFDEYQKELFFSEQIALIKNKGVPFLKGVLGRNTTITPLSLIVKGDERQVSVDEIFSEIQLEEDGKKKEVLLEDLIQVASGTDAGSFILLKGHAGMGKSTLVKKITSDWVKQQTSIKGLSSFDLLFYAELRDYVQSFQRLLECSLGKDVHHSFRDEDLIKAVLGLRILVILDGYDELNKSSSEFFQEILALNKLFSQLTLIVTTRPEAEERLNAQLKSSTLNAVYLKLVGIKAHERETFVAKYFLSLPKNSSVLQELDELLELLRKTEHKMSIVWESPYNLCLLTILWMFKPDDVNGITTEAELYWQIFLLSKSKLEERLLRNQTTCDLELSILQNKTKQFLEGLSWESLSGLRDDFINLPLSIYQRLTDLCLRLEVPVEELAGAFLKKVTSYNNTFYYTFPHKGFMEFMGAYYIYKQVTRQDVDQLAMQQFTEELSNTCIAPNEQYKMLDLYRAEATKKPTVTDILIKLHGGSLPDSLEKYQNLLFLTISIFHVGEAEVPEATKIEALELLEKSGLRYRHSILKVLHNIKCNDRSSRWIAQRFNLFDKNTIINDSSIESYLTLLAATDPPLPKTKKTKVVIDLQETPNSIKMLAWHLSRHQLYPRQILLTKYFDGVSSPNTEETESIKILLAKDCDYYKGTWSPTFHIPRNMSRFKVRFLDQPSLNAFCESLKRRKTTEKLTIHFSVSDVSRVSHPIPLLEGDPPVHVLVSDVTEEDIEKVGHILRALHQQNACSSILFPRCSLRSPEQFLRLLDSLKGIEVSQSIHFSDDKRPDDEALCQEMDIRAKDCTGCEDGIAWNTEEFMFIL